MNSIVLKLIVPFLLLLLMSCEPGCPEYAPDPNLGRHGVWLRNPVNSFIDSSGNALTLLFKESTIKRYDGVYEHDCSDLRDYSEVWEISFFSPDNAEFEVTDNPRVGIKFPDFTTYGTPSVFDTVVAFQGKTYDDGRYFLRTDSTGNLTHEVYISNVWGLVMFGYKDEYRWERVLD
jgi:hypothetical protein